MTIRVKRAYDPAGPEDGVRYLVDRLWPRGITKENLKIAGWLRELSPSNELRRWYNHDPLRWEEFKARYFAELQGRPKIEKDISELRRHKTVTLLYSAKNREINNAVALKMYLEKEFSRSK
ncbi:MAG TPA: DUF488 family protein [Syntrophales bacterium]|nr:DUF488 family protein [Syntrophales bacterium]